jgi:hypothetical protein
MGIEIGDGVTELVGSQEIEQQYDVPQAVARRLWERFNTADLNDVSRDRLQEVRGVGPVTASEINPPRSDAFRALQRECGPDCLFPVWKNGVDDKLRLPEENPDNARSRINDAARRARAIRTLL